MFFEDWTIEEWIRFVIAICAIIGLFGGIPAIKKWVVEKTKSKPKFSVEYVKAIHTETALDHLKILIRNVGNELATGVTCQWVVYRSDTKEHHDDSHRRIEDVGYLAPDTPIIYDCAVHCLDPSCDYRIKLRISCREGIIAKEDMKIEITA